MTTATRSRLTNERMGNFAFIVVVIVTFFLMLATALQSFAWPQGAILVAAGVVYLLMGIYGYAYCERTGSLSARAIYFAVQIPLGTLIVFLSRGAGWLIMMPLVAQSVALPRPWMLVVNALHFALFSLAVGSLAGLPLSLQGILAYLAAMVFVFVFAQITVNEQQARGEVERLAVELQEANRKLREYAAQVEELATAKERNRLAREIHDGLGHYLTAINMQIEAARAVVDTDRPRALEALTKAQALTKEGLSEVRRSVAALRASPIEDRPLREALAALAAECRAAGIVTELQVTGTPRPLPPQTELALYRAAEESLTNVRKHAHASRADIALGYSHSGTVRLMVQDNGVGTNDASGGFGLLGVRERVQLLGGQVRTHTAPGQGFVLEVEVPG